MWCATRLRFLGKVLSVQKSYKSSEENKNVGGEPGKNALNFLSKDNSESRKVKDGSRSASLVAAEPIAEKLGVNYPFPPHLEYVLCLLLDL